jgi:hypothetical protein
MLRGKAIMEIARQIAGDLVGGVTFDDDAVADFDTRATEAQREAETVPAQTEAPTHPRMQSPYSTPAPAPVATPKTPAETILGIVRDCGYAEDAAFLDALAAYLDGFEHAEKAAVMLTSSPAEKIAAWAAGVRTKLLAPVEQVEQVEPESNEAPPAPPTTEPPKATPLNVGNHRAPRRRRGTRPHSRRLRRPQTRLTHSPDRPHGHSREQAMAIQSFDSPPAASGILEHGNHVLKITKALIAYGNRGAQLEIEVTSVSPHSAGQTLRNQKFLLSHSVFTALGFATRAPAHDDEDDAAIVAALDQRVFARNASRRRTTRSTARSAGRIARPTTSSSSAQSSSTKSRSRRRRSMRTTPTTKSRSDPTQRRSVTPRRRITTGPRSYFAPEKTP